MEYSSEFSKEKFGRETNGQVLKNLVADILESLSLTDTPTLGQG